MFEIYKWKFHKANKTWKIYALQYNILINIVGFVFFRIKKYSKEWVNLLPFRLCLCVGQVICVVNKHNFKIAIYIVFKFKDAFNHCLVPLVLVGKYVNCYMQSNL